MKKLINFYRSLGFLLLFAFTTIIAFAQEKKIEVDIDTNPDDNWWKQPWVWIGGAVFIILLVALLRRKRD